MGSEVELEINLDKSDLDDQDRGYVFLYNNSEMYKLR